MTITEAQQRITIIVRRRSVSKRIVYRVVLIDAETQAIQVCSGSIESYDDAVKLRNEWRAMRGPVLGTVEYEDAEAV